jgi:hypothetical protein
MSVPTAISGEHMHATGRSVPWATSGHQPQTGGQITIATDTMRKSSM